MVCGPVSGFHVHQPQRLLAAEAGRWSGPLSLGCSWTGRSCFHMSHVSSVLSSRQPSHANQFRAAQEVFGEWSFQLSVNTSELGQLSVNSAHEQRASVWGLAGPFTKFVEPGLLHTILHRIPFLEL